MSNSEPPFGHSLMEDVLDAQREWNRFLSYAMNEAIKGNPEPMMLVGEMATERVRARMEARARGER